MYIEQKHFGYIDVLLTNRYTEKGGLQYFISIFEKPMPNITIEISRMPYRLWNVLK